MIINKEEVEKAAEEYCNQPFNTELEKQQKYRAFLTGEKFAESKFNEMFLDIICENQGLKLYKDNEAKRFKKLAVEFAEFTHGWNGEYSYEELFEMFIGEKDGLVNS